MSNDKNNGIILKAICKHFRNVIINNDLLLIKSFIDVNFLN